MLAISQLILASVTDAGHFLLGVWTILKFLNFNSGSYQKLNTWTKIMIEIIPEVVCL